MKGSGNVARKCRKDSKGRVLKVGESQDKTGRYCYKWTNAAGKRCAVYGVTLKELREKENQIQKDQQDGIDSSKQGMTLNQLFSIYMDTKTGIRATTRENYLRMWNSNIKDSVIGNMKVFKITQMHIKRLYADFVRSGKSYNTIKLLHNLLYPSLQMAVDSNIIRKNPAVGCKQGIEAERKTREALTIVEQNELLSFVFGNESYSQYFPLIVFALSTGLRVGELTGLRWADVDLKDNVIHIRQQLIYKNLGAGCKFYISELKTDAGRRDIPLTAEARKCLIKQKEQYLLLGKAFQKQEVAGFDDYVFTNSKGRPYAANAINFILKNIVDSYNETVCESDMRLPRISAHILRHTGCTRMAESGIDPKTLQYIMGHSDINVTMNIYNHVDTVRVKSEMAKAEGIVSIG